MAQKPFATIGTIRKLSTISDYLHFYTRALGGRFHLSYVDAFAGTGEIPSRDELPLLPQAADLADFTEGSAVRALGTTPSFDRFIFIDAKQQNADALNSLGKDYPEHANKISVVHGDANDALVHFCQREFRQANDRAVVFLDPFGNQVSWDTVKVIAETPGIDLWYLFPAGLGVLRQITKEGTPHPDAEPSLDLMFGTTEWRNHLIRKEVTRDLFGETTEKSERVETAAAVTEYMISRMKTIFEGGVLDKWLPLGKRNGHWYSLILAWSNPSPAAGELIKRVGKEIIEKPR